MLNAPITACWIPTWNADYPRAGFEHVQISQGRANSILLAIDEDGEPFRLLYELAWDPGSLLLTKATLTTCKGARMQSLSLSIQEARWKDGNRDLPHLDGCIDIDIWPTPLTNSFPLWRSKLQIGQRKKFRMAWVSAPGLTIEARAQAYTRLDENTYLFESLDESGFKAELTIDESGVVIDYPNLFERVNL